MRRSLPDRSRCVVAVVCLLFLGVPSTRVFAHGLHGHIHVTGWAIENLPPGELKSIFDDPDVFKAALSGAMFPDTGYAPPESTAAREYGEAAHWEPFIERFVQRVRAVYGPAYETKEEKMLIAFLLGCAAHGLQDELFDSTFLYEVEERDGRGQDVADPATDGFLALDGYFRLLPGDYFPIEEVLPLYEPLNQPIDRPLIESHINTVKGAYVNDGFGLQYALNYGRRARPQIPWAGDNYIKVEVPGSLAAEIEPTARHMEALWERLHGRFDEADLVVHAWPDTPRRLRSAQHQQVASWVTLILGKGIEENSATTALVDAGGAAHPYRFRYTRWGGTSRLIRFQPMEDFLPGGEYTAIVEPGAELVDGSVTSLRHEHHFQVECDPPDEEICPAVIVEDDPTIALPPTATPSPSATPTQSATPTPTPPLYEIDGCVVHFSGCGGSQEFGTVHLSPLGLTAAVDTGWFSFENVPPGDYVLTYSPACNPAGCTGPVHVRIDGADGYAAFNRSSCAADCSVDFTVTVNELLVCVSMALDGAARCIHCDPDSSGEVTVDELVRAVDAALNGCR